jgi:hypothetical protein
MLYNNYTETFSFERFWEGDTLNVTTLVKKIGDKVLWVLPENTWDSIILRSLIEVVELRAQALDVLFNNPPREEESCERNGPSIAIYTPSWELDLVNTTYIQVSELPSGSEAKRLAKEGGLVEAIYDEIESVRVKAMSPLIKEGGYCGKVFTMKSGFRWRWTSLPNKKYGGDIRVAEDVTEINDIKPLFSTEGIEWISFGFYNLVQDLREKIDSIMPEIPELLSSFEELSYLSYIWDVIVDEGPFFVCFKKGDVFLTVNKAYVAASWYTLEELQDPRTVLYKGGEKGVVTAYVNSLKDTGHYHGLFYLTPKSWPSIPASWDTFAISSNTNTTVRIGSMAEPGLDLNSIFTSK